MKKDEWLECNGYRDMVLRYINEKCHPEIKSNEVELKEQTMS